MFVAALQHEGAEDGGALRVGPEADGKLRAWQGGAAHRRKRTRPEILDTGVGVKRSRAEAAGMSWPRDGNFPDDVAGPYKQPGWLG